MIKSVLFAILLSASGFALSGAAMAQTSTDTEQTDQSEEDWRKSQKKSGSSDDILDIIKNTRSSGFGNGRGYSPIDSLPEESRRHLMNERAKRMAQAGPGEPVDVSYTPSGAAKSDPSLQDDETAAWEEMTKDMNGSPDISQDQQGSSQTAGQLGGQAGGYDPSAQGPSGDGSQRSVMRGGSSASVADIMAQIKGLGQGPTSNPSSNPNSGEQSGDAQQGSASSQGQQSDQAGQAQNTAKVLDANDGQSQNSPETSEASSAQSDTASQANNVAEGEASSQSAKSSRAPDPFSPLERLQQTGQEQSSSGSNSSASDYLKTTY